VQSPIIAGDRLRDKVALIIDGTNGRSLALSLARYGADIAIVFRRAHARQVQMTKKLIETEGRRCLIIPAQSFDAAFSKEVVKRTVDALGRLDIFIDCTKPSRGSIGISMGDDRLDQRDGID
jgi:NAD(P)-dependent dehydrogenase (short-subunit alcohol dehydrogenase family)